MSRYLPIIAVQSAPVAWDVDATWAKYEAEVRNLRAEFPQTRLILHPELFLAGLGSAMQPRPATAERRRLAEPVPGPLTDRLCALARELDVWLVPGSFYERGEDGIYNTAVAIAPDGTIRAKYRKVFPWRPWEQVLHGTEFVVFDIDGIGRAGLMICYDGWFPEVSRHLAWMGAEVILHPSLTTTSDRPQEVVLARANAIVNQVFVVNVNAGGGYGHGLSTIVDPEGHELQTAGPGEVFMTEVLDLDAVTRVRQHGTVAMSRMWKQLAEEGGDIKLPLYGGSLAAARIPDHEAAPAGTAREG
jgi:formamidase